MKSTRSDKIPVIVGSLALLSLVLFAPAISADVPDHFTNLKVLPKDISKEDLVATMRAYSSALGVRCGHCHARPEGAPEGEPDYASDQLPEKETARVMMRMTQRINSEEIPKVTVKDDPRVQVRCRTCHHGEARPFLVEDVLSTAYKAGGFDSLAARYDVLRTRYYGSDTFNFSPQMLPSLGEQLAGRKNPAELLKFVQLNLKRFPDSGFAHFAAGQALGLAGTKDEAERELKKAAELDPKLQENVRREIEHLGTEGKPAPGGR